MQRGCAGPPGIIDREEPIVNHGLAWSRPGDADPARARKAPGPGLVGHIVRMFQILEEPLHVLVRDFETYGDVVRYRPFGGGPRQCIGSQFAMLEAQLVVAAIAQRFRFRRLAGPGPTYETTITLRPRGGLPMRLEQRPPGE